MAVETVNRKCIEDRTQDEHFKFMKETMECLCSNRYRYEPNDVKKSTTEYFEFMQINLVYTPHCPYCSSATWTVWGQRAEDSIVHWT